MSILEKLKSVFKRKPKEVVTKLPEPKSYPPMPTISQNRVSTLIPPSNRTVSSSDDSLATSVVIGAATHSPIIGGIVGGSLLGGYIGSSLIEDSSSSYSSCDSSYSSDSYSSCDSSSSSWD